MLSGGTFSACAMVGTAVFRIVVSSASMKKPMATSQGSSRLAVSLGTGSLLRERGIHDGLRIGQETLQMRFVAKTLGVDLVDILGARRTRREPAAFRGDFDAADGCVVARRVRQHLVDFFAHKFRGPNLCAVEQPEFFLLRRGCRRIDSIGEGFTEFAREFAVGLPGIAAGLRGNLGR